MSDVACIKCGQQHAKCSAHNRAGNPCGRDPMVGGTVCMTHGGKAPQTIEAAANRVAEQEADKAVRKLFMDLDAEPITNPYPPLQRLAGQVASAIEAVTERINEMRSVTDITAFGAEVLRVEVALCERLIKIFHVVLVDMAKLGIEERMTALNERQGALMAEIVRTALADPRLGQVPSDVQAAIARDAFKVVSSA